MMNTLRLVSRRNVHQFRCFHKCAVRQNEVIAAVVEPLTVPPSSKDEKPVHPKIDKIAQDITALNLLEVAELSDLLKKRLNLPDAPVMPIGGFAAMAATEDTEDAVPQKVQSLFTVNLVKYDETQKVALIKEIKSIMPNTNLVQAKKFVDNLPGVVKVDIEKDEAERLKEAITKVGGVVEIS